MDRGIDGGGRSRGLDLEVYDLVLKPVLAYLSALAFWLPRGEGGVARRNQRGSPFPKSLHTHPQVSSRLKLRVCYGLDRDVRQRMSHENTQMFWEIAKRVVTALNRGQHMSIRKNELSIVEAIGRNDFLTLFVCCGYCTTKSCHGASWKLDEAGFLGVSRHIP